MRFVDPMKDTPEGQLLGIVRQIEKAVGITKNYNCSNCSDSGCPQCNGGDNGNDTPVPQTRATGGVNRSTKTPDKKTTTIEQKLNADGTVAEEKRTENVIGDTINPFGSSSKTTSEEQLTDHTLIQKYWSQETSVENVKPMFVEISGKTEIPASGYQGNQVIPFITDASAKKGISETYKMPSVSQTGYDVNSSSLHMHYNNAGGDSDYRAKIEESLGEIRKHADAGQIGIIDEIAGTLELIYARL